MSKKYTFAPILVLLLLTGAGMTEDASKYYLPEDPLIGAEHFTQKGCITCHSIEGRGGDFGPDLASSDLSGSLFDIVSLMWNHSPEMSSMMTDLGVQRPKFTGKELAELAAYVFFIAYFDRPGDIAEGQNVFIQKGCMNCHQVAGIGTEIGPDLSFLKRYVSPIFLSQEMWNHGPDIRREMKDRGVKWPEFNGAEISDLLAFLRDASTDTTSERIFMRPGNPVRGKSLFQKKGCSTCHRVFGVGNEVGPDLRESSFHMSVTSVAAVMWNHGPTIWDKMEEVGINFPQFSDNEMADLIAYLYFLRFFEKEPDKSRGEMLFSQKGCSNCHTFDDSPSAGTVSLYAAHDYSRIDIAAKTWNHALEMSQMMTRKKIGWPRLNNGELNDLVEYIRNNNRK